MFRIKTDIRQFNCETREKVEKLIRSWVIRPTDLMLDDAHQTWSPIGDHEDFAPLFTALREGSEVDMVKQSDPVEPLEDLALVDAEELDTPMSSHVLSAQILSGHGKLKLRALANEESEPLPLPVAPKGVEPPAVSDELTLMTERTADLLGVHDEDPEELVATGEDDEAPLPLPVAPRGVEQAKASDEATQIFEREEDEERGYELEELSAPSPTTSPALSLHEDSEPRLGRHDLPEELFLTSEISRSELVSPLEPVMDDLRNADSSSAEDSQPWEVTRQIESPLDAEDDLSLSDDAQDDLALREDAEHDIHSEWENMMELDELRETDEFSIESHVGALAEDDSSPLEDDLGSELTASLPEPGEASSPDEQLVDLPATLTSEEPEAHTPQEEDLVLAGGIDDTEDFHAADLFDSDTAPPPSLIEESAPTLSEHVDLDEESEAGVEDESFLPSEDFVSEGYAIPLPFVITPSGEDLKRGIRRSTATERDKDMLFPRPRPKRLGELATRRYGYGDTPRVQSSEPRVVAATAPKDYSRMVAIITVILVVLIIASLIIIFD